ncbi:MAG: hypothetical protein QXK37_05980 [Candidatus Woesearchaeota archaeon]
MSYKKMVKLFENRKEKLLDLTSEEGVPHETRLRLEGAIDEIDFLLRMLKEEMNFSDDATSLKLDERFLDAIQAKGLSEEKKVIEEFKSAAENDSLSLYREMQKKAGKKHA